MRLADGTAARASVPQGKSCGRAEAAPLPAGQAVRSTNRTIATVLKGKDAANQGAIDRLLIKSDGTATKRRLGANAILAASVACARATAVQAGIPLWQHLRRSYGLDGTPKRHPLLLANLINGGLHAQSGLRIQEYLVVPKTRNLHTAATLISKLYRQLARTISSHARGTPPIGDEGGFVPSFKNDLAPLSAIKKAATAIRAAKRFTFGIDAAASNISTSSAALIVLYSRMASEYDFTYLEDPLPERDFLGFAALREKLPSRITVVGDDLTTTNVERMKRAYKTGSVNGVIIKPTQIGTLTETFDAIRAAKTWKWKVFVSHRSGETNDDCIADLAFGTEADGIKLGAPARGERTAKYNRLLELAG